jgi:hypothetical protein
MNEFSEDDYDRIVPGYHGTDPGNAASIVNYSFKIPESERNHLGDGVYFYENSIEYAKEWARETVDGAIAVIRSEIRLGKCLELHDPASRELIETAKEGLESRADSDVPLPVVINHIDRRHDLDTVRAVQPRYSSGKIAGDQPHYWITRIIICVKDPAAIEEVQIVYRGD